MKQVGFYNKKILKLPKIDRIYFELNLHGTYPDEVRLSTDLPNFGHHFIDVDDNVDGEIIKFYVETGAQKAHLHLVEYYNSEVTLTPLNPCLLVDKHTLDHDMNKIIVKQSIYDHTVTVSF